MSEKKKSNHLKLNEYFQLTKLVEDCCSDESKKLESWSLAEEYFSKKVNVSVTRHHIETALKAIGKTSQELLSYANFKGNWLTQLRKLLDDIVENIEVIEKRINKIEEDLK